MVNDIKKAIILYFEQLLFKGSSCYLDIDMAERFKPTSANEHYIKTYSDDYGLFENRELPVYFTGIEGSREADTMFMRDGFTDESHLYKMLKETYYHKLKNANYKCTNNRDTDVLFISSYFFTTGVEHGTSREIQALFVAPKNGLEVRTWANGTDGFSALTNSTVNPQAILLTPEDPKESPRANEGYNGTQKHNFR